MFNVAVPLKSIMPYEAISAMGSVTGGGDVSIKPSPFSNSVVICGTVLQNVVAASEAVGMLDSKTARMIMVQAVVLRTDTGHSSSVGVWRTLQTVVAAGGFGSSGISYDPMSGLLTMGSVTAVKEIMQILGSQNVEHYGFKVESRPILSVVSGQQAWFQSGQEVPVPVTTQTVAGSQGGVTYKKIQFSLGVIPSILPDGRIALAINQSNDDVIGQTTVSGSSVPTVGTQSLTTRIEIMEGQAAVLGGIEVENKSDDRNGFPVLGHVPVVNWLFGNRDKKTDSSELLIVITAFVVLDGENPCQIKKALPVKSKFAQNARTVSGAVSPVSRKKNTK